MRADIQTDRQTDKQTDKQTDTFIAIHSHPSGGGTKREKSL